MEATVAAARVEMLPEGGAERPRPARAVEASALALERVSSKEESLSSDAPLPRPLLLLEVGELFNRIEEARGLLGEGEALAGDLLELLPKVCLGVGLALRGCAREDGGGAEPAPSVPNCFCD